MKTKKRYTLSKKLVAQVRYYETMYLISDSAGNRVFTGSDRKTAKTVLTVLNSEVGSYRVKAVKRLKRRRKTSA